MSSINDIQNLIGIGVLGDFSDIQNIIEIESSFISKTSNSFTNGTSTEDPYERSLKKILRDGGITHDFNQPSNNISGPNNNNISHNNNKNSVVGAADDLFNFDNLSSAMLDPKVPQKIDNTNYISNSNSNINNSSNLSTNSGNGGDFLNNIDNLFDFSTTGTTGIDNNPNLFESSPDAIKNNKLGSLFGNDLIQNVSNSNVGNFTNSNNFASNNNQSMELQLFSDEEDKAAKIEEIDYLRNHLSRLEDMNIENVPKVDMKTSSMQNIDNVLVVLRRKMNRVRTSGFAEDIFLGFGKGVEHIFDGRTEYFGHKPDARNWTAHAKPKILRFRYSASRVVEQTFESLGLGEISQMVLELGMNLCMFMSMKEDLADKPTSERLSLNEMVSDRAAQDNIYSLRSKIEHEGHR